MSMFTGFVIADFDSFKKQRKSEQICKLRHHSLVLGILHICCSEAFFNPTTLLSSSVSLTFLRHLFWPDRRPST